jgi:hypothetical protein
MLVFRQVFDGNHRLLAIRSLLEDFARGEYHGTDEDGRRRLTRISSVVYKQDCPVRFQNEHLLDNK